MSENLRQQIAQASDALTAFIGDAKPVAGIILGSGLNPFADGLEDARVLPFQEVPHMCVSTADGHKARFVIGTVPGTGKQVLCMQGRLHAYEGFTSQQIVLPVWAMQRCGIDTIITTNAAGAINPNFNVGDFCLMIDQINLTGRNPIVGIEPSLIAERFVPMQDCFDPELREIALQAAAEQDVTLQQGVYLALLGPSFETPAEIRAFGILGADTVAMSVAEEVIAARHVGMRVMGISMVSNMACGVAGAKPNADEVMDVAKTCEQRFSRLIAGIVAKL